MKNKGTGMPEEKDKQLFTRSFAKKVRRALALNNNETGDTYHHPSENRIVSKCIDLSCQKPLHAVDNEHPKSSSEEKWLEAYLIRKAKRNNWELELAGRKYRFLYSQLNFRAEGSEKPQPLDLLLYEKETRHLVILELKAKRELERPKKELERYSKKLNNLKDEIAGAFGLGEISGVRGYIVWPRNERANNDRHDFSPFGVIEYTKIAVPWKRFKELGENLTIEFVCVRESQVQWAKL